MIVTSLIPIDEVVHFDVCTHDPSTGDVSDADSTPAFDVFEEATDTPILSAQSFTKRTSLTGNYRGTFTASAVNGFEAGKWYSVIASATVGGVSAKKNCGSFRVAPAEVSAGVPLVYVNGIASGVIAAATFAANALDAVWSTATRVLTAGTNIALAKGTGVTGFNDLDASAVATATQTGLTAQGYTTTRAGYLDTLNGLVQAIWDKATSALTTASSIGKLLVDNINATISSRLASASYTAPLDAAGVRSAVGLASANLDTQLATLPTAAENADAVWDEAQADHVTADTFGAYLDASISGVSTGGVSAADIADAVLDEALSGHTTAGTLGKAVADVLEDTSTTLQGELDGIQADTEDIQSRLPAALTGAGNLKADAQVVSDKTGYALTSAYDAAKTAASQTSVDDLPTNAELATALAAADDAVLAAIAALNNLSAAQVNAEVDTALSDAALATAAALSTAQTAISAVKAKTDKLTFDASNNVAANAKAINGAALTGDGTESTPWGPA